MGATGDLRGICFDAIVTFILCLKLCTDEVCIIVNNECIIRIMIIMLHCPLALQNSQAAAVAAAVANVRAQDERTAQRKRKREADNAASSSRQVGTITIALPPQAGTLRPQAPANDPPLTAVVVAAKCAG